MSIGLAICFTLGSVIAGITVGVLYSCIYIRVVYKKWISLWIVLQILFRVYPNYKRGKYLESNIAVNKFQAITNSLKKSLFTIPFGGFRVSFPGQSREINRNAGLSLLNDFIEKQTAQPLPGPETDGTIVPAVEIDIQNYEPDTMLNESPSPEVAQPDTVIISAQESPDNPLSAFLDELARNRQIINEFAGDQLLPLETTIWDANQTLVNTMTPVLKKHLNGLYNDIALLNNLVWLSTEFNRISPNMLTQYTRLIEIIAANLEKMLKVVGFFSQDNTDLVST